MKLSDSPDLLTAAATARINQRAAAAYLHDLRGSLHAVQGALELLVRLGRGDAVDPAKLDKAAALAKRAVAAHEMLLNSTLNRLTDGGVSETTAASAMLLPLPSLVETSIAFLRHDLEAAGVRLNFQSAGLTRPAAMNADRAFVLLVGLLQAALDSSRHGDTREIRLSESQHEAELSIALGTEKAADVELTLTYAAVYLDTIGGALQRNANVDGTTQLLLRCPLLNAET